MSPTSYRTVKLDKTQAKNQAVQIARKAGNVILTRHAEERMLEREIIVLDILNVLKSSAMRVTREAEWNHKSHSYSYSCETNKFRIVVSFSDDGNSLIICTAIRK